MSRNHHQILEDTVMDVSRGVVVELIASVAALGGFVELVL